MLCYAMLRSAGGWLKQDCVAGSGVRGNWSTGRKRTIALFALTRTRGLSRWTALEQEL